eukprot:COSAG01_NODE_12571_length_1717_cov_114.189122_2_plen_48_part_01
MIGTQTLAELVKKSVATRDTWVCQSCSQLLVDCKACAKAKIQVRACGV